MNIKIYPLLAFSAQDQKCAGGFRVWCVAKKIDEIGRGRIYQKELYTTLREMGVPPYNISRWMNEAEDAGLLHRVTYKKSGEKVIFLTGIAKVAFNLHVTSIGDGIWIDDATKLFKRRWKSTVWTAYLAGTNGKPISQKTKENITGISPRVQRNYQKNGESTRIVNVAETNYTPNQVEGLNENTPNHYYEKDGKVLQRLPNSYKVSPTIALKSSVKTTRTAQHKLNKMIGTSDFKKAQKDLSCRRLFNSSERELKVTNKKLANADTNDKPHEIFHTPREEKQKYRIWKTEFI